MFKAVHQFLLMWGIKSRLSNPKFPAPRFLVAIEHWITVMSFEPVRLFLCFGSATLLTQNQNSDPGSDSDGSEAPSFFQDPVRARESDIGKNKLTLSRRIRQ